jgi:hypothetical protein
MDELYRSIFARNLGFFMEIEQDGHMVQSEMSPGSSIRIPPLTKHRVKALEDTLLLEVSTPELEDVVCSSPVTGHIEFTNTGRLAWPGARWRGQWRWNADVV